MENESEIAILSTDGTGGVRGKIQCGYVPTDETGEGDIDESLEVEEPEELLGKDVHFLVKID